MTERFHFFWNGPFSQWDPSPFTIAGVQYNCAEQWMMAEKARLFNVPHFVEKIMQSKSPREQKALGRKIPGYNDKIWLNDAKLIVYRGSYAKFTQNEYHMKKLVETKGITIVEASPEDTRWGIGLGEDDPRIMTRSTWLGDNWLGEVLTKLRIDLVGA